MVAEWWGFSSSGTIHWLIQSGVCTFTVAPRFSSSVYTVSKSATLVVVARFLITVFHHWAAV